MSIVTPLYKILGHYSPGGLKYETKETVPDLTCDHS